MLFKFARSFGTAFFIILIIKHDNDVIIGVNQLVNVACTHGNISSKVMLIVLFYLYIFFSNKVYSLMSYNLCYSKGLILN